MTKKDWAELRTEVAERLGASVNQAAFFADCRVSASLGRPITLHYVNPRTGPSSPSTGLRGPKGASAGRAGNRLCPNNRRAGGYETMRSMAQATQQVGVSPEAIPSAERSLAVMTHLSGLAGYIIPLGGVIVPIVIWIVKSDNRTISAIAKQAVFLNVVVFLLALLLFLPALTLILIPISIVGWLALALAALALPIIGAVKASEGTFYSYPVIGTRP